MATFTDQDNYVNQKLLVSSLVERQSITHGTQNVKLIETHISWVLMVGRYAFKIKKALNLGFLNFTSLESRRFYCSEEVRLNCRLAPKSYLDVIPIGGSFEYPEVGLEPAIEYAVRMRRFAYEKRTRSPVDPWKRNATDIWISLQPSWQLSMANYHVPLPIPDLVRLKLFMLRLSKI